MIFTTMCCNTVDPNLIILLSLSCFWDRQQNLTDFPKSPNHRVTIHQSIHYPEVMVRGSFSFFFFFFFNLDTPSNHYQPPPSGTTHHGSRAHASLLLVFRGQRKSEMQNNLYSINWHSNQNYLFCLQPDRKRLPISGITSNYKQLQFER